jgi:lipoprotein-anchoring transpeptidase ErfK/SrfK
MAGMVAVAGACSGGMSAGSSPSQPGGVSAPPATPAVQFSITPSNGHLRVPPGKTVMVSVTNGKLTGVTARAPGDRLTGKLRHGHSVWMSRKTLHTATRYTVHATAVDADGHTVTATSSFRTLAPSQVENTTIFEAAHGTYGVGMPITLTFDHPVTNRRAVERALHVRASKPVTGAWYWDGDSTVYFRPRNYWPEHTTVHFEGDLNGVEAAPGVYGTHTLKQVFTIGDSVIAVASTTEHHVQIYRNKKLYATWPISTGKPGDDTPNGTYLTIEKGNPVEMKGPGYDLMVPFSVRFTWSGDYMHDAYWSVGEQGFTNVSHGCVNLSPANAETYYNWAVPGDPVTVTGSPRGGAWGNGWTVWFLTWNQLVKGSALHRAIRVGKHGDRPVDPSSLKKKTLKSPVLTSQPGNADPA